MADQKHPVINLEELNNQFSKQLGLDKRKKQLKRGQKRNLLTGVFVCKRKVIFALIAVIVLICIIVGMQISNRMKLDYYASSENEMEYKEQFEKVNILDKYLGLNETVKVTGQIASIGLVNSLGSDCSISIKIYDREKGDVLYESKQIMPGSLLHKANLKHPIESEASTVIDYTVYDLEDKELGTYQADVVFGSIEEKDKGTNDE